MNKPYAELGALLKGWRLRAGIEHQSDLAKLIGTQQQNVNRWEVGTSRPRPRLIPLIASVLGGGANELLRAAGYSVDSGSASSPTSATFDLPFPIDSLAPESFERFCYYFLAATMKEANVSRAGGPGHSQDGLDIEAVFPDGKVHSFQCKRVSEFGPQKVHAAVAKHTKKATKKVLLISRGASPQARDAARTHKSWEIWDKEDISRRIRGLPKDEQRRLVDIFFRGQRFALLGETEPGPWQTLEEFFQPFANDRGAFSHNWTLVGKDEEVAEIGRLLPDGSIRTLIISGAGGAGKTRLLKQAVEAYAAAHADVLIRFLSPTEEITTKSLEDLGDGQKLLVVDDAHDRTDLPSLFQYAAGPQAQVTLLLAVRSYGLDYVKMQASSFALTDDSMHTVQLKPLALAQAKALALQVLEKFHGSPELAEDIARLTRDCPLATVVGAQVLSKGKAYAELVKNENLFRSTLLGKFQDVVAGEIGDKADAEPIKKLLRILALIQPFHPEDESVARIANAVEGIADHDVSRLIRRLTEAGVLFKRGGKYRLSPDLLADHVIEDICIGPGRVSTGYAEKVFDAAQGKHTENLFLNLGKLDWRLSDGNPSNSRLMEGVWQKLRPTQDYSDPHIRAAISVAFFQPERALDFAEQLIREGLFLRQVPNIIRYAAYNFEQLDRACVLLWELGMDDRRQLNPHPEHAVRILSEMCAVEPNKPVPYNEKAVDFALSLFAHDESWDHYYSPFDILQGFMRPDGHTTSSQGVAISITKFSVRHEAVSSLRKKVIGATIDLLSQPDTRRALLAAKFLQEALRYPMDAPIEARVVWTAEFVQTLKALCTKLADQEVDPLVRIAVSKSVTWHAHYADEPTRPLAAQLINSMPQSLDFRTILALVDGHGYKLRRIDNGRMADAWDQELTALAEELIAAHPDIASLLAFIDQKLAYINAHNEGERGSPQILIGKLISVSPAVARHIIEEAIANSDTEMRYFVGNALAKLLHDDHTAGLAVARRLLDTTADDLRAAVGHAYCCLELSADMFGDEDVALLREVLKSDNEQPVLNAVRALRGVARVNQRLTADLILAIDLGKSTTVTDDVFMLFADTNMLSPNVFTGADIDRMLDQLMALPSLDGYWVEMFVARISKDHPQKIVEFLKKRVERAIGTQNWDYRACNFGPYVHHPLQIRHSGDTQALFRDVSIWIKSQTDGDLFRYWAPKLFEALFSPFDDGIVAILRNWVDTAAEDDLAAITLILTNAPSDFVFAHRPFIMRFMERAKQQGRKFYDHALSAFYCAAIMGMRQGTPGQPFPEDLKMRDEAEKALNDMPRISAAYNLYAAIKKSAEENISQALKLAETLEE